MTLPNLITDFLEYLEIERNTSQKTIENYDHYLKRFLGFARSTNSGQAGDMNPKDIDLAFIPGLAFSEDGLRLGYGKGVYDRLLTNTKALKFGVCFDFQIIDNFSSESHDLRVDFIITERRIIKTQNI